MSDAGCVEVRQSKGILTIMESIHYLRLMDMQAVGRVDAELAQARRPGTKAVTIKDSGWINFPPGSRWRMLNTTMSCTGNVTHFLAGPAPPNVHSTVWTYLITLPLTVIIASLGIAALWLLRLKARATTAATAAADASAARDAADAAVSAASSSLPEHALAFKHGYDLLQQVGAGHYGRVFLARPRFPGVPGWDVTGSGSGDGTGVPSPQPEVSSASSMQTSTSSGTPAPLVAVKVIMVYDDAQLAVAYRECQHVAAVCHPCCVRTYTHYAARIAQWYQSAVSVEGNAYLRPEFALEAGKGGDLVAAALRAAGSDGGVGSASSPHTPGDAGTVPAHMPLHGFDPAAGGVSLGAGSSGSTASGLSSGSVALQFHLVMQYCDQGTLDAAISGGRFASTTGPNLRWILLTARDIACGLEYLHATDRRMVHRDLSAANVMLLSSPVSGSDEARDLRNQLYTPHRLDDRGFRAMLSDFGLATVVASHATHRTSHMRGTVAFMSPEVFETNDITPALDVYSLGILLFMLYAGASPYAARTPAQIILLKVKDIAAAAAAAASEDARPPSFPLPQQCPPAYAQLVADCTHPARRQRATAADVRARLEAILDTL